MTENSYTSKATVKVVRQQLHEITELNRKYADIASNYRDTLNAFADLKIMNTQLRGENKKLKVLLQVATKEIQKLKEVDHFKEWQKNIKVFDMDELEGK